jgi:WD40 repeat protein
VIVDYVSNLVSFSFSFKDKNPLIVSADHSSQVRRLLFSYFPSITSFFIKQIQLWDLRTPNRPVAHWEVLSEGDSEPLGLLMSLAVKENNSSSEFGLSEIIVSGHEDGSVAVSDLRMQKSISVMSRAHSEPVFAVEVSNNGQYIVSGAGDGFLYRHQLQERKETDQEIEGLKWIKCNEIPLVDPGKSFSDPFTVSF